MLGYGSHEDMAGSLIPTIEKLRDKAKAEGRKLFPGKCILGGFDNNPGTLIDTASRSELREYVGKLIAENGYKGYILGADCSIPNLIDDRRVREITDAARTYTNRAF